VPEIIIYLAQGRAKEAKRALMKDITDAVVKNFGVNPEAVVVQIVESSRDDKFKGGVPFSER
jgi:4-oxalocrotonate tautomerase